MKKIIQLILYMIMSFSLFGVNSFHKTGLELKKPVQFESYDVVNAVLSNCTSVKLSLFSAVFANMKESGARKILLDGKLDYGVKSIKSNIYTNPTDTKLRPRNKCDYVRCGTV